jgi:hypothetical protein
MIDPNLAASWKKDLEDATRCLSAKDARIAELESKLGECEKERLNALDALGKVYDGLKGTQSKLAAAEKERDRAVAKAARMAELDPDGDLRGIDSWEDNVSDFLAGAVEKHVHKFEGDPVGICECGAHRVPSDWLIVRSE